MQKITPFLWFDNNAEEAVEFYTSVFKNSSVINTARYPEGAPGPAGSMMTATIELNGQRFMVLNGGPHFKFTEAVSFVIDCDTQEDIDYYWEKLTEGGSELRCGWLKDKFGLSWQVVPTSLGRFMSSGTPQQSKRVMDAFMKMNKFDISILQRAFDGV